MTDTNLISQYAVTNINFLKFGSKQHWPPMLKWLHFFVNSIHNKDFIDMEKVMLACVLFHASQIITLC
jgi:hypothetical protein